MKVIAIVTTLWLGLAGAALAVKTGTATPDFTGKTSEGTIIKLSNYTKEKKVVVLEWLNHGCPFVKKQYKTGAMQQLQKDFRSEVVWLSVISSAPGTQGHSSPEKAEADRKELGSKAAAIVLDEDGKIGKLYGAQTTPHMYVIDASGKLVYQGAIDNNATTDSDEKPSKEYVREALAAVTAKPKQRPVPMAQTKAYGCGVKYRL